MESTQQSSCPPDKRWGHSVPCNASIWQPSFGGYFRGKRVAAQSYYLRQYHLNLNLNLLFKFKFKEDLEISLASLIPERTDCKSDWSGPGIPFHAP